MLFPYENAPAGVRTGIDVDKMLLFPRSYLEIDAFFFKRDRLDEGAVRLLRRLNTRFVISQAPVAAPPGLRERQAVPNESAWPFRVYEVEGCWPATYLAGRAHRLPRGEPTLSALEGPAFEPYDVVLHDDPGVPLASPDSPGRLTLRERSRQAVRAEVELARPAALVVLEHDLPGWRATVNSRPVRVLGANQIFLAVALPAGRHAVELRYAPTSVSLGLGLSLATLVAVLLLWLRDEKPTHPNAPETPAQPRATEHADPGRETAMGAVLRIER
jgi:hypothetical protein